MKNGFGGTIGSIRRKNSVSNDERQLPVGA
jgi:hypothetical protein